MKITNKICDIVNDLNNNKVVCFKTDTIWGLSANPYSEQAMNTLYKIKQRDKTKPFIFLIKQDENINNFVGEISKKEKQVLNKVWPGPVSVIFKLNTKSQLLNYYDNIKTIALRMPKNKTCQSLLKLLNYPLPSTSVNKEGEEPINNFEDIKKFLQNEDITILKSSTKSTKKSASTLITINGEDIVIIRGNKLKKI